MPDQMRMPPATAGEAKHDAEYGRSERLARRLLDRACVAATELVRGPTVDDLELKRWSLEGLLERLALFGFDVERLAAIPRPAHVDGVGAGLEEEREAFGILDREHATIGGDTALWITDDRELEQLGRGLCDRFLRDLNRLLVVGVPVEGEKRERPGASELVGLVAGTNRVAESLRVRRIVIRVLEVDRRVFVLAIREGTATSVVFGCSGLDALGGRRGGERSR